MTNSIAPEPRHSIAEVLRLIDRVRSLAFDTTLTDDDVARRVRDLLNEHNNTGGTP
jgi:hypothetical protein